MRKQILIITALFIPSIFAANSADAAYKSVIVKGIPHVQQKPDFCGEACAEMYLRKLGKQMDQDYVYDQSGLDPIHGRGCYTRELTRALQNIGFRVGRAAYSVAAGNEVQLEQQFASLHADLVGGTPSIICMHYDDQPETTEHFRLIVGYDSSTDEVLYHEPAVADGAHRRMKREMLLKLWPLKYSETQWTTVRMPLLVGRLRAGRSATSFTDADYAQHILELKRRLPSEDFKIVLQKPFVVVGDEDLTTVKRRAQGTVKWSVDRLKRTYFARNPETIIDVWLFKDKESYDKYNLELFGNVPHTPFGFYSSYFNALVMNISTGGGTLVHEIVHPFMESNFPDCPAWFNEGLASLYEQCGDNRGRIWGRTNWRLKGLQEAIGEKTVPPFEMLCGTTTLEFYDEDPGTNYSQARYLCYYLQQKGVLAKYYHEFVKNSDDDPTGFKTLQRVLGEADMVTFQKRWEEFVLGLKY